MERCPLVLPKWSDYVTEEQFNALSGQGKVNEILVFAIEAFAKEAHKCAIRQNALVDYVEEIR